MQLAACFKAEKISMFLCTCCKGSRRTFNFRNYLNSIKKVYVVDILLACSVFCRSSSTFEVTLQANSYIVVTMILILKQAKIQIT